MRDQNACLSPALQAAHQKRKEMREAGIKIRILNPYERLQKNPKSLRLAINAMCWQCQGEGHDPNVREAIRDCNIRGCALYSQRPWQTTGRSSS